MNICESMVAPLYAYYINRGRDFDTSSFHCRFIVGSVLWAYFLDVYKIATWISKKEVYLFGRFLFSQKIDFYVLGLVMWIVAYFLTNRKKWKQAYEDGSIEASLISPMAVTLVPFVILGIVCLGLKK